jgi:hypothetical protein
MVSESYLTIHSAINGSLLESSCLVVEPNKVGSLNMVDFGSRMFLLELV